MRIASCQCGGFRASVAGDPSLVNICHCRDCQRRTGVAFSSNAYFPKEQVRLEGRYDTYSRNSEQGRKLHNHFCPDCGTTVAWLLDLRPNHYGIAVGAFNDPAFPAPTISVWEESKYAWVTLPEELRHFSRGSVAAPREPSAP